MKRILTFEKFTKMNEMTEFNLQRLNDDSVQPSTHVDDPNTSMNAYDRHLDNIRGALTKISDISKNLSNSNAFTSLKAALAVDEQNISKLNILRITKNDVNYNVYINFMIDEVVYWGVIENILDREPIVSSEVFNDNRLYLGIEWIIKTKGILVKTIKNWLEPDRGVYKSLKDDIYCISGETGKMMAISKDVDIEVIGSDDKKITITFDNVKYTLKGDNYIYFNWWFQKVD